ncbi:MAG: hypothetical protein LBB74_07040 [Chitinispirillales bacterium]|jgi:hypothetical protein|nr:hypothetical protein [Chitinispirillales bacterium]
MRALDELKKNTLYVRFSLYIFAAAMLLAPAPSAKTRALSGGNHPSLRALYGAVNIGNADNTIGTASAADLEARLRPILEERAHFRRGGNGGSKTASPALSARNPSIGRRDLFAMMKSWNSLSPDFRALYEEATAIPRGYSHYISPGGNFKVFYTTTGSNSVSLVDTVGYGATGQPNRWRDRHSGANGVPDYVDEAAFALDSAWSMEVERFGFPKPKAAPDPDGSTAHYCVLIIKSDDYGVTYPTARASSTTQYGFASYIEVNGNWSGREWAGLGYDQRPYDALRVTCAHEFFHSIQYSMVWTIDLDALSYGWLEGSAVLMEELAFPEVNDYLQYLSSYFSNPRIPLLSDNSNYVYMNSIVLKYLYEKGIQGGGNIGIVKAVHDNNLAQRNITFHGNITKSVSDQAGREWASVLNGFHAESYFSGTRARPWAFISDAELMGAWRPPAVAPADTSANIGRYSAGLFMYKPQPDHGDTLILSISGQKEASTGGATWGMSAIVTGGAGDGEEIVPINVDVKGYGRLELAGWSGKGSCLLVATNAGQTTGRITVKIGGAAPNAALLISPNKVNLRKLNSIYITGGDISEATIAALNGRVVDHWNIANGAMNGARSAFKTNPDGSLEWSPYMLRKRTVPGIYFITASATNPNTGKKSVQRRKIMLLP